MNYQAWIKSISGVEKEKAEEYISKKTKYFVFGDVAIRSEYMEKRLHRFGIVDEFEGRAK